MPKPDALRRLTPLAAVLALLLVGCSSGERRDGDETGRPAAPGATPIGPDTAAPLPERSLEQLKAQIQANGLNFRTLRANCRVTIANPRLTMPRGAGGRRGAITLSGRMAVSVPRRLKLYLEATGKTLVEVTGNGNDYLVDMPGIGPTRYRGVYDMPLTVVPRRVSMLPDDLAEIWDQTNLFAAKSLVLKAYADYWVIEGIRVLEDPPRVTIPASFWIKREETSADNPPRIAVYTKFDPDGDVRCNIRLEDYRAVPDTERGIVCFLPHRAQIAYPLERTVINFELSDVELNPQLRPGTFDMPGTKDPTSGSITRIPPADR
jgi:hypothetical protein